MHFYYSVVLTQGRSEGWSDWHGGAEHWKVCKNVEAVLWVDWEINALHWTASHHWL